MIFRILHGLNHGPDRPPGIVDPGRHRTEPRFGQHHIHNIRERAAAGLRLAAGARATHPEGCRHGVAFPVRTPCAAYLAGRHRRDAGDGPAGPARSWWRRSGSNRRPPACKAGALPAELRPPSRHDRGSMPAVRHCTEKMVGLGRLELPTSRLSGVRSNQAELQAPILAGNAPRPHAAGAACAVGKAHGLLLAPEHGRDATTAVRGFVR